MHTNQANIFGATSTTEDVLSGVDLHGKRILVTGVSARLGVETARALAAHGAQVVGAIRNLAKAETATAAVRKDAAAHGGSFELVELDLASLKSVRACAGELIDKGHPSTLSSQMRGGMATPFGHTSDGFETQFGTNHLGHFVFVNRSLTSVYPAKLNITDADDREAVTRLIEKQFGHLDILGNNGGIGTPEGTGTVADKLTVNTSEAELLEVFRRMFLQCCF
jgi:NAD(P)-dependent dehydrogenase (short-subunit alcohol dehydrogenase family)